MALLRFISGNGDARKIFGKRELKIIEKQLLGVNLTQSEKNRLSRDIRKKCAFITSMARFKDELGLKKGAEIRRLVEDAKQIILEDSKPSGIVEITLFGSAVENKLTLRSDIDISVRFKKISLKEATFFRKRVSGKVSDKLDIQVYNVLPKKIKTEIDSKGRVI